VPAPLWLVLAPRARAWGLAWLALAVLLSLATLPLTIVQLEALFGFGARPLRLDYLVLAWALIPWLWRHPDPFWWLHPTSWPGIGDEARRRLALWRVRWRANPEIAAAEARSEMTTRVRHFLGLGA